MNELAFLNTLLNDGFGFDVTCNPRLHNTPSVDVKQTKDSYVLQMDLPGMTQDDIDINVKENTMVIASTKPLEEVKKETEKDEKKNETVFLLHERSPLSFKRSFTLPRDADNEKIEASFTNGLLTVTIARRLEEQPKKIAIKIA